MSTLTITNGLVGQEAVAKLVEAMQEKKVTHIFPSKVASNNKFRNEAIDELLIDDEGNVLLSIKDSDQVILPQFITVCK